MKKILLSLMALVFLSLPAQAEEVKPMLSADTSIHDFGEVDPFAGPVSTDILITNNSDQTVTINRLSTSCGCTTATMDTADFTPGESRKMKITFDPAVHQDQRGEITRMVYLQNSDPQNPEMTIELIGNVVESESPKIAKVFFNEACQDCGDLVKENFPALFAEYGYKMEQYDYINERQNRQLLNEFNQEWDVPFELQSHIEAFIGENLLIGGHVPESVIRYLIENPDKYEKLLVYQDEMHGDAKDYKVWDFQNEIATYKIDEPITTYFKDIENKNLTKKVSSKGTLGLFAIITSSAFLDGINPCAIAVLLFFIAFLFTIKKTKASILKMGLAYIFAIYLAYLLIGVGIAQAIIISGAPHLMAYIGAYLVIALGVFQLLAIVFPKFPIRLRIPVNTKPVLERMLHKSTIPAALIGGFVVGLCTFPCSGGIYVAIIGMLTASQTYSSGLMWMLWYNLVFVAPLIIILVLASNPKTTEKLQKLERQNSIKSKVVIGITMIALGLFIIWFIN